MLKQGLLWIGCLGASQSLRAQGVPVLWKAGLNLPDFALTHTIRRGQTQSQLTLPLTGGLEVGIATHTTLYGQAEVGWQIGRAGRRGTASNTPFGLGLGGRYYYQPIDSLAPRRHGVFAGRYLGAEIHTSFMSRGGAGRRRRRAGTIQTIPSIVLLWGTQFQLSRHLLCDLSLGPGMQHDLYSVAGIREAIGGQWKPCGQVNAQLYFLRNRQQKASK